MIAAGIIPRVGPEFDTSGYDNGNVVEGEVVRVNLDDDGDSTPAPTAPPPPDTTRSPDTHAEPPPLPPSPYEAYRDDPTALRNGVLRSTHGHASVHTALPPGQPTLVNAEATPATNG